MENPFKKIENKSERVRLLRDNAVKMEELSYPKTLSSEQLSEMKDELAKQDISLQKLEDEKKEVTADYAQRIKVAKAERNVVLHSIRTGVQEVTETVYLIDDQDERKMYVYNEDGDLISSRPLKQEERQMTIKLTGTFN
ncbi:hypothetical protein SAMN05444369_101311 [Capnocytophaga haemolytica]|uniref:Uncharacterized protein n=1 Tax=Capnocytophaga haemolytica TaxID=45243 RepID=A0AAX2GVT1_9FLAO|nr:hypothetical protein [Capnocytophaga haemolytica]AMD85099.1 hypothetical protein AXF12_05945 [Capnocytophaga haemolytica]SFN68250.1 hypothetical protein SAMN05444369_101311 [Capnocytophaga haemolytica]SNV05040.1 Uncharacterised protein [Capnocytophaga haemolytica]